MSYKKTILAGTLILTASGFFARILGFYNRIFLAGLIGAKELGIYQLIFPIYMLCFSLCCHGFETGASNLTSRFFAQGQKKNAHRLVRLLCLISFTLSLFFMGILFEGADYVSSHILKEASAAPALKIASLTLPLVSVKACLHGYYIGKNRSSIPAVSQIVEQISRVGGIYLLSVTVFLAGADARIAAWGMMLGETASTVYTIFAWFPTLSHDHFDSPRPSAPAGRKKKSRHFRTPSLPGITENDALSSRALLREFFTFSIPISINHFCLTAVSSLETILIPFMLKLFCHSHTKALSMYGTLTGMALPFLFFPATITNSLSVMLMPAISSASKQNKNRQIRHTIEYSLHYCLLIGIFSTFAFLIYGKNLGEIIFQSEEAGQYVRSFSLLCPLMYLTQASTSILNGFEKTKQTLYHNLLGVGVRIFFILTAVPVWGIQGYLYGLLAGYSLQLGLNLIQVRRLAPFSFSAEKSLLSPTVTALAGGIFSEKLCGALGAQLALSPFFTLAVSGLCYFFLFSAVQLIREKCF